MAFGQKADSDQAVRNYAYGMREPVENLDIIREQIRLAHQYQNKLIELERKRREDIEAARRAKYPDFAALEDDYAQTDAEVERLLGEIKKDHAATRTRRNNDPQKTAAVKAAKLARKKAWEALKARRAEINADASMKAEFNAITTAFYENWRQTRANCGVYWGTYLLIEAASQKAFKSPAAPRFRRWTGEGAVGCQIMGGMTWADALSGEDTRFRIEIIGEARGGRKIMRVHLRIASENREPVWAVFTGVLHRPLPESAVIKWARLQLSKVARSERWELILSISAHASDVARHDRASTGRVAIDLGWKVFPGGIRVASWLGDDGCEGELVLPRYFVDNWSRIQGFESVRASSFNSYVETFKNWVKNNISIIPPWMVEGTVTLAQWKSPARLASLMLKWRNNRFSGDEKIYRELEGWLEIGERRFYKGWRKQDAHLWEWSSHLRDKLLRRRKNIYRNFATMLRRQYAVCIVEDVDWREIQKRPSVENSDPIIQTARRNQRIAAVSGLKDALVLCGPTAMSVESSYTSITCAACNRVTSFDSKKSYSHICEFCGHIWEKGKNASKNIMRAASGVVVGDPRPAREVVEVS